MASGIGRRRDNLHQGLTPEALARAGRTYAAGGASIEALASRFGVSVRRMSEALAAGGYKRGR